MSKNILLCGVGGQGTVLASKLIAGAAMKQNIPVMSAETIGMAQRGGSVFSYLRMGENLYAPVFEQGSADLILGFEPGETVRMLPYLKQDGSVVVSSRPVMPVTAALSGAEYDGESMIEYLKANVTHLTVVDAARAFQNLGSAKVLNVVLLGAALATGILGISAKEVRDVIRETVAPRFRELNLRALDYAGKGAEQA